jgi:hypothetical protein
VVDLGSGSRCAGPFRRLTGKRPSPAGGRTAAELAQHSINGIGGRRQLRPVIMEQHDRARMNRRQHAVIDHARAGLLEVTRVDIPQDGRQAVAGERLLQPTVRQAERGSKQSRPRPADRLDRVRRTAAWKARATGSLR